MVEKVVHDPDKPPAPKPQLDPSCASRLEEYRDDVVELERLTGRSFGWPRA